MHYRFIAKTTRSIKRWRSPKMTSPWYQMEAAHAHVCLDCLAVIRAQAFVTSSMWNTSAFIKNVRRNVIKSFARENIGAEKTVMSMRSVANVMLWFRKYDLNVSTRFKRRVRLTHQKSIVAVLAKKIAAVVTNVRKCAVYCAMKPSAMRKLRQNRHAVIQSPSNVQTQQMNRSYWIHAPNHATSNWNVVICAKDLVVGANMADSTSGIFWKICEFIPNFNFMPFSSCTEKCTRTLICGHPCPDLCAIECAPCKRKCTNSCVHSKCSLRCGDPCPPVCSIVHRMIIAICVLWNRSNTLFFSVWKNVHGDAST